MVAPHDITWVSAAPLWSGRELTPGAILGPDLLRFESDDFMEELTSLLASAPSALSHKLAKPKSYRARPSGAPRDYEHPLSSLRLYQPVHGHFNLVMASLTCRLPGLPDHAVELGAGEQVAFVLRRLRSGDRRELAWVKASATTFAWVPVDGADKLQKDEELLPLFQVPYREKDRTRRMWAGLIPTSSRDTFVASALILPDTLPAESGPGLSVPDPVATDDEFVEARARVIEAISALKALDPSLRPSAPSYPGRELELSTFFLLDLADLLRTYLPRVWEALPGSRPPEKPGERALYDALRRPHAQLGHVGFAEPLARALAQWKTITGEDSGTGVLEYNLRHIDLDPGILAAKIDAAYAETLPTIGNAGGDATSAAALSKGKGPELPRLNDGDALFVVRCVYRRTRCRPPHPDLVSKASAEFTIAPYLDPDAPYRPVRIALPVDTSVKGLRRFRKNVAFLMSDQLRKQMSQATNLQDLLDGKAGSEQPFSIGEICSFSIPVITICAFIVLMIFMILLNFVFWWLPFLKFCFPIKVK